MKRVRDDGSWSLFCPKYAGYLADLSGDNWDTEYMRLEASGLRTERVRARVIFAEICHSLIESGGPAILFKDSINSEYSAS